MRFWLNLHKRLLKKTLRFGHVSDASNLSISMIIQKLGLENPHKVFWFNRCPQKITIEDRKAEGIHDGLPCYGI